MNVQVQSFHLNVGAGDGAIHLLTRPLISGDKFYSSDRKRLFIVQAFMVDGGRSGTAELIESLIERIECSFDSWEMNWDGSRCFLKFDAFIVSHWDNDHYDGLEEFLTRSLSDLEYGPPSNRQTKTVFSRAYYHANGSPASFAYSPWKWPDKSKFTAPGNKLSYKDVAGEVHQALLVVRAGAAELLGRNLFRQRAERTNPVTVPYGMGNFDDLMVINPIQNPDELLNKSLKSTPALYCIAAEERWLGEGIAVATLTNKSSLILVLAWKTGGTVRISHYLAGDAEKTLESAVCGWINRPITSMKLSHHGASTSNPREALDVYNPKNVVVSAGAQYGHPRWEVIANMSSWFTDRQQLQGYAGPKPLYFCQWPYYLVKDKRGAFVESRIGIGELKKLKDKSKKALDQLKASKAMKKIQIVTKTVIHKANRVRGGTEGILRPQVMPIFDGILDDKDQYDKEAFLNVVYKLLPQLSALEVGGVVYGHKLGGPSTERLLMDKLLCLRIVCDGNANIDGRVKMLGSQNGMALTTDEYPNTLTASQVKMMQDIPNDCSIALRAAKMGTGEAANRNKDTDSDTGDGWLVDMSPNKGFDQPRVIDLTNGNPDWDAFLKSYQGKGKHPEILDNKIERHDDDWIDLEELSPVTSFGSRRTSSATTFSDIASDLFIPAFNSDVQFEDIPSELRPLVAKVYLTCKDESDPTRLIRIPEGSIPCILDSEHPLAGFLNTLHYHSIGLAKVPNKEKSTPVHSNDEMYQWLAGFCGWDPESMPSLLGFTMGMRRVTQWPLEDLNGTPLNFEMTIPLNSSLNLMFSTDEGARFTFSKIDETDPDPVSKSAAGAGRGVTPEALNNMLKYRRMLVFGLEKLKDPVTITLKDLATFMKVDLLNNSLVQFLTEGISLTLDTDKDFHNALWFRPSLSYETHMRLQFHMETVKFNQWLHTLSDSLNVDTLWVIGRKKATWMWTDPKDQMTFESSLSFLCRLSISATLQLEGIFKFDENSVYLTLTLNEKAIEKSPASIKTMGADGVLSEVMDWVSKVFGVSNTQDFKKVINKATALETGIMDDNSIIPRRIEVTLDLKPEGGIAGVRGVSVDIEACLTIGRPAIAIAEEMPAVFLFTFGWSAGLGLHLVGKLWTVIPDTPFTPYDRALPEFEEYEYLNPVSAVLPENQLRTIDIARLLSDKKGEVKNLPAGIPNEIYLCEISLSQDKVAFRGALRCSQPQPLADNHSGSPSPPMPPTISLENVALQASYTWGTKSPAEKGFEMSLAISVALYRGEYDEYASMDEQNAASAKLTGLVKYDKGEWTIEASVYDLSVLHLLQFWDLDDRGPVSDCLGKIKIDFVTVRYEFKNGKTSTGAYIDDGKDVKSPSLLKIEGRFAIASAVSLGFEYMNTGGDGWFLKAELGPTEKPDSKSTVGGLLSGFMDETIVNSLPEAIREAEIPGGTGPHDKKAVQLVVAKQKGTTVFALMINVGAVSVWFIQINSGPKSPVKRLIKAAISKISVDVPTFQTTINSPWEDLFFMWVQDQTVVKEGTDALTGITQKEYDHMAELLKERLAVTEEQLRLFKPAVKKIKVDPEDPRLTRFITADGDEKDGDDDPEANKVVMPAGSHLIIVAKKPDGKAAVILDYLFGTKKKKPAAGKAYKSYDAVVPPEKQPKKEPDASGSEKGTKTPLKVKLGPLSVGNVGLWFKEGMIGITLDANLIMGPLGFSLLGFTIGVPFSKDYSLSNPPPVTAVDWGLKGLILSMDKPPLTIAGGFMRDTSDPKVEVMYTGGIVVGFKPWSFEAMGAYATVKKEKDASGKWITTINTRPLHQLTLESLISESDGNHDGDLVEKPDKPETFTFAFIYVKLNGPLFSVGFADIAGVVGGFGINSDICLPTVEQVTSFPFVAERDSSEKVSAVEKIQGLMDGSWFRPAEGLYWAAAGARVTAFQMLAANIVLVLQFGNGNLLFGIFGVATCDVPALEAPVKFAHVELGIVCTYDVASGIFKFEAQLSPRSFVLSPQCHLTGGMALFAWSKDDHSDEDRNNRISAGDWVLTIGGFHRAFKPPKQYPKPPRLGISWSLSSCLSVKGEAYFAITPKVCMGGGKIRAALSIGALYAWFDAFMDFLMNFEPFFFQMTARVSVGVRYTLDLWLVTIRISVEIAAGLDLTGPPFGGVVHVDFWVFGFDIKFGASPRAPAAVDLNRFFLVATKTGSSSASSSAGFLTGGSTAAPAKSQADTAAILLTCETGLLPPLQDIKKKSGPGSADDGKWYVKGGNFSLMATFQIPVTEAQLTETRKQQASNGQEQKQSRCADCPIGEKFKKVYARPMQLYTPLTSKVSISVEAPEPRKQATQDIRIMANWQQQKWKLTPQIKPVQSSIWGQYNKNQDPALVKGPIEGLLNGQDATMQLVTGITIVPPDPQIASDKVNKFNITEDHRFTVFHPQKPEWPLFIGVGDKQQEAWHPKPRSRDWKDVTKKWSSIGDATTSIAVNLWAKRMRYDEASFKADQNDPELKDKFSPLRGIAPQKLLKNYESLVPALPLVARGYPEANRIGHLVQV